MLRINLYGVLGLQQWAVTPIHQRRQHHDSHPHVVLLLIVIDCKKASEPTPGAIGSQFDGAGMGFRAGARVAVESGPPWVGPLSGACGARPRRGQRHTVCSAIESRARRGPGCRTLVCAVATVRGLAKAVLEYH